MTLSQAQKICSDVDAKYMASIKKVKWTDIYISEQDMLEELKEVNIPENRTAPSYTYKGYEFIYSFAYYLKQGWKLSEKQIAQCKRLALEIKKAYLIRDYC